MAGEDGEGVSEEARLIARLIQSISALRRPRSGAKKKIVTI
jgi:hypothetical protein